MSPTLLMRAEASSRRAEAIWESQSQESRSVEKIALTALQVTYTEAADRATAARTVRVSIAAPGVGGSGGTLLAV